MTGNECINVHIVTKIPTYYTALQVRMRVLRSSSITTSSTLTLKLGYKNTQ